MIRIKRFYLRVFVVLRSNLLLGILFKFRLWFRRDIITFEDPYSDLGLSQLLHTVEGQFRAFYSEIEIIKTAESLLSESFLVYGKLVSRNDINIRECDSVVDEVRMIWEAIRDKHLVVLAMAYRLTGKKAFKKRVFDYLSEIHHWDPLEYNYPYCPMEASARLLNWTVAIGLITKRRKETFLFPNEFIKLHRRYSNYIWRNYEITFYGLESNHSIANLLGLALVAKSYNDDKIIRKIDNFILDAIRRLKAGQFDSDGFNFEHSTSYHVQVVEMLFFLQTVASRSYSHLLDGIVSKSVLLGVDLIKKDGSLCNFGDSDGGTFFYTIDSNLKYSESIRFMADVLSSTNQNELKKKECSSSFWVYANDCLSMHVCTYRSIGTSGKGNHQHNDFMSFELSSKSPFIVDPGTYCYLLNRSIRNSDRSMLRHNMYTQTTSQDDDELFIDTPFENLQLLELKEEFRSKDSLVGHLYNYNFFGQIKLKRTREIMISHRNEIQIIDFPVASHGVYSNVLLIPKHCWNLKIMNEKYFFFGNNEQFILEFENVRSFLDEDFYSPSFLIKKDAYALRLHGPIVTSLPVKTLIKHKNYV